MPIFFPLQRWVHETFLLERWICLLSINPLDLLFSSEACNSTAAVHAQIFNHMILMDPNISYDDVWWQKSHPKHFCRRVWRSWEIRLRGMSVNKRNVVSLPYSLVCQEFEHSQISFLQGKYLVLTSVTKVWKTGNLESSACVFRSLRPRKRATH